MAFWGREVKPGRPFTHTYDSVRGRLHISQATLGIGTATAKTLVQCNVGDKSPVFLCSLVPEKTETCQLNLEFEEADEVTFSVIGPRSVHLTGFYLATTRHSNLSDDTESYGEDIPETETERSADDSDEDEYDDSFIDDDDFQVSPPSPISNGGIMREEIMDKKKPKKAKDAKAHRRLRKKYQLSESDSESGSRQQNVNGCTGALVLESEDEESLPISSLFKSKTTTKNSEYDPEEKASMGTGETSNKNTEDDGNCITESNRKDDAADVVGEPERQSDVPSDSVLPPSDVGPEISAKSKKKSKEQSKDVEADSANCSYVHKEDKSQGDEAKAEKMDQDMHVRNEQDHKATNDKEADSLHNFSLPSTEVGPEDGAKPKTRREEQAQEGKTLEADITYHSNLIKEDNPQHDEAKADNIGHDLLGRNEQNQKQANDKGTDLLPSSEVGPEDGAKPKKRRKERANEGKTLEADNTYHSNVIKEDNHQQDEANADISQDLPRRNAQKQKQANDDRGADLPLNVSLPSTEFCSETGAKPKKKRKEREKEGRALEADYSNAIKEEKTRQDEAKADNMGLDLPMQNEQNHQRAHDKSFGNDADRFADENKSVEKKSKKKKKKSKTQEKEAVNMDISVLSKDEKNVSVMEIEDKNANSNSSQVRTLSNGLIIEELEMGKPGGKIAAPGKKISVHYIGKLEKTGQVFDSNVGGAPFRFRIGAYDIIEGWNVGLDGMRVGDKRRLIVPPLMGYGSEAVKNVPPNSWLVYDVELVKVR